MGTVRLLAVSTLALALVGCGSDDSGDDSSSEPETTVLEDAYEACPLDDAETEPVSVRDDGETLLVDGGGEAGSSSQMTSYVQFVCILGQLDASSALMAKMDRTTAMMGVQTESENGVTYEWTYHPDNGMDAILTLD